MLNYKIEEKESFRIVGYQKILIGENTIHAKTFPTQKTDFFKELIQTKKMQSLKSISESPYGYGAVVNNDEFTVYYPSIKTNQ